MKQRLLKILLLLGLVGYAQAQEKTAIEIGAGSASAIVGDSMKINISIGGMVGASSFVTIKDGSNINTGQVIAGVPPSITYFPAVFGSDLFVSKGYYPDYVQLSWDVISQSEDINRFKIFRKPLVSTGDSVLVATVSGDATSYRDEFVKFGVLYKYTLFAEGIADDILIPYVNLIEGNGFALPEGSASGRITFGEGTAVAGVSVVAETEGNLQGKSLYLDGTNANVVIPHRGHDELNIENGFTLQFWVKSGASGTKQLFSRGSDYSITYDQTTLSFTVGDATVNLPFTNPADSFFHVTASYDPGDSLNLYATVTSDTIYAVKAAAGSTPSSSTENFVFGGTDAGNRFLGNIDEIRLWNKVLSRDEIRNDAYRFIATGKSGLVGYWRIQAGLSDNIYDASQSISGFNENHGTLFNTSWSDQTPLRSQLAIKGVTDKNGNYIIEGIPYESSGSTYRFIPLFGIHEFDPTEQLRLIGPGASVHNGINFEDVSSFKVSGTIRYRHSAFPVQGVSILVDGNPVVDGEGNLILSGVDGTFTIDVPIGLHSLRLSMSSHVFEDEGRFPPKKPGSQVIPTYDFQKPLSGLQFIDSTLVKIAGKIVGGPVEADKQLGFGLSVNNIGNAQVELTSEKGFDITTSDSTSIYNLLTGFEERDINASSYFTTKYVTIDADPETGEYIAYLPPEKYVVTNVTAGTYTFGDEHKVSLNLEQFLEETDSHEAVIYATLSDGSSVPGYSPIDSSQYDAFDTFLNGDTTFVKGIKDFSYQKRKDFILRLQPEIDVVNKEGLTVFGASSYIYSDELRTDTLELIDASDNYTFGHPVFLQQNRYDMYVSVFEEYINADDGNAVYRVPVSDGKIEVTNDFGTNSELETVDLDENGEAIYSFNGGFPNLNKDATDAANSFTRPFSLVAVTGEAGNIRTTWREGNPMRGIVFGGVPQGNNFVTNGPNQIISVLRDPPGSESYTYLEQGSTTVSTTSWSSSTNNTSSDNATISLGAAITTFLGIGAGTIFETDITLDTELGFESQREYTSSGESVNTTTVTKNFSTSQDQSFVGSSGDVFIGHSTNIVYGQALSIQPIPVTDEECTSGDCDGVQHGDFKLGPRASLRLNPAFGTMFVYTQTQIENVLIPNLIGIRNSLLSYSPDPESVAATDEVIYLSLVDPSDERYGSANYDKSLWGEDAVAEVGVGPSYQILIPASIDTIDVSDTIAYYNKQIAGWIETLKDNEKEKLEATLKENISFDGGTTFSSSTTIESSNTKTYDFNVSINSSFATTIGVEVLGIGSEVNFSRSVTRGRSEGGSVTNTSSTTYGYNLADGSSSGENSDYYSIDIKEPQDGYGPVFVTRAGVSSCPYEGEEKTKYYQPGQHTLNFATVQVEKPELTIVNPTVANVPSNRQAEITLELKNNSEDGSDVFYNLSVNDQSNPNGAILSIDGSVLTGDGRGFLVPAGSTVTKILRVSKGSDDINEYENISLSLSSQCDDEVSDEQSFSVYFQPGCSDIRLVAPVNQWVVNTNTTPKGTLNIVFDDYDVQNGQFRYAKFQYKAISSSQWLTSMIFYNPVLVSQTAYDEMDEPKAWLDESGSTGYAFDMGDLPDRSYDLRVVSVCETSSGKTAETPTETHTGVKDTNRPVVFGAPQPADGILSADDEILIQFDEPIEAGLLTPFNFSVKGVLNSAEIGHSASVNFDGVNDYMKIGDGLHLSDRSFTLEFWIKREHFTREQVVYSNGYASDDVFEIGFNSTNNLFINIGGQLITSSTAYTDIGWNHFAVTYSVDDNEISAYMNDQYAIDAASVTNDFAGEGGVLIGKSRITNDRHFEGNIHDLRIWTKYRQLGDVFSKMSARLTGSEVGLIGYWPMDEAFGTSAFDRARSKHAILFADWEVSPQGKSYDFDGADDYVELNTGSTVIITDEMDYTIEFWFKTVLGSTNTVMFSSGKGDGTDEFTKPENSLNIGFDGDGMLYLINNGQKLTVSDADYRDDNWHHFSFSLLRRSNANILIDGIQKATIPGSNFGGLSGTNMWLGVRGYKTGATTKDFDRYFSGSIDEFRVWNLSRKARQIDLNKSSRLRGDEIGLVGYYPFESYENVNGVPILNPTLDDQWENPFGPNGGSATASGGADFSDDTPNIKDARPVESVDFDWAVNQDKIIITADATFESLIEQTVLEITVRNVEDAYENRIASPVTWTAFVDRNQLKWDTDKITASKEIYQPYSFAVDVVNLGGTETDFVIDNLPLWLSATPSNGVLSPASSQTVTFTVNEGLNTGYYLEDVFLSSDFGFDEKLTVDLTVFSPEPEWDTNPFEFQFSMNLVSQVEISNILSSDVNDRIAAFVNDTVRGDANIVYVEQLDLYEVFLDIYSNVESGEQVELRVWDASTGTEYRNALPEITFSSNLVLGSSSNPERIVAGNTNVQKLTFQPGWNWVSTNISSGQLADINTLMSNVSAETGDQIKGVDKVDVYTEGFGWSGTLSSGGGIANGPMYLFHLSNGGSIEVIGSKADLNTNIPVQVGWNWIGFLPRFNMSVDEAFASFNATSGDIIKSQFAFAIYQEGVGWTGTLNSLHPGKGYLFKSASAGTLVYPESTFLGGRTFIRENRINVQKEVDRHKYPSTMSVIAEFTNPVSSAYLLAAYREDEIRGIIEPIEQPDGRVLYFLTIYGEMVDEVLDLKAIDPDSDISYTLDQTITFGRNDVRGSWNAPLLLTGLAEVTGTDAPEDRIIVYPNPFVDYLTLYLPDSYQSKPRVVLAELSGKEVMEIPVSAVATGWSATSWVTYNLSAGVYIIHIYGDDNVRSFRILKEE